MEYLNENINDCDFIDSILVKYANHPSINMIKERVKDTFFNYSKKVAITGLLKNKPFKMFGLILVQSLITTVQIIILYIHPNNSHDDITSHYAFMAH